MMNLGCFIKKNKFRCLTFFVNNAIYVIEMHNMSYTFFVLIYQIKNIYIKKIYNGVKLIYQKIL